MSKKKGMNNASGKAHLVRSLADALVEIDARRKQAEFLSSEEGQRFLIEQAQKQAYDQMRGQFEIGQLVWRDDIMSSDGGLDNGTIVNCCSRIIGVIEHTVQTQMLYAIVGGEKMDGYTNWMDLAIQKGDVFSYHFGQLQKHLSKKTGFIWWKVTS